MKAKDEVQEAHYSGKQYTLHCSLLDPPNPYKFIYHLSDDTIHDGLFVETVLRDIIQLQNFHNQVILIKSDNCPSQYKCKNVFPTYQKLCDEYDITMIRIYGAAGHGRGLIDAMSSFGCKAILRQDIMGKDIWFNNSGDIVDYLSGRGDTRMLYRHIDMVKMAEKRISDEGETQAIKGSNSYHLFVFKPNTLKPLTKTLLCDCEKCLMMTFEECEHNPSKKHVDRKVPGENNDAENDDGDDDYNDDDDDVTDDNEDIAVIDKTHLYDVVQIPSFVTLFSPLSVHELFFVCKVTEKSICKKDEISDSNGHKVFQGEKYFTGRYLQKEKENKNYIQYELKSKNVVYFRPHKIHNIMIDIDEKSLRMPIEEYIGLMNNF